MPTHTATAYKLTITHFFQNICQPNTKTIIKSTMTYKIPPNRWYTPNMLCIKLALVIVYLCAAHESQ